MLPPGFSIRDYFCFLADLISGRRSQSELDAAYAVSEACSQWLDFTAPLKILDLGSGRLCPQAIVRGAQGHDYIGVDLANRSKRSFFETLYFLSRWIFRFQVQKRLLRCANSPSTSRKPLLLCGSVDSLPILSSSIDLVVSVAAFEHFLDIPEVLAEAHRVLKPGGILCVYVHHFSSLSGGHSVGRCHYSIDALPSGAVPWDHLRGLRTSFSVPLNFWRPHQYLEEVSKSFELFRGELVGEEGTKFLTPDLMEELREYSVDELIKPGSSIVAQKREG